MAVTIQIPLTPTTAPSGTGTVIPHLARTTFWDLIEHMRDWAGADASQEQDRTAKRSILAAYRELVNAHNWSYLYQHGRVQLNGFFGSSGGVTPPPQTIQVQVSSGPLPNYVTLTGGTWPGWAPFGSMRIGNIIFDVDRLIDSTHLTLVAGLAPVVDQPAGTVFTLYRDTYTLPADFVAMDEGFTDVAWGSMETSIPICG